MVTDPARSMARKLRLPGLFRVSGEDLRDGGTGRGRKYAPGLAERTIGKRSDPGFT